MKRIISLLAVMAIMAAMVVASAMPAFAQGKSGGAPNCERGQFTAAFNGSAQNFSKHLDKAFNQCGVGLPGL